MMEYIFIGAVVLGACYMLFKHIKNTGKEKGCCGGNSCGCKTKKKWS